MATLMDDVINLLSSLSLYGVERISKGDVSVINGTIDQPPTYESAAVVTWTRNTRQPRAIGDTAQSGGVEAVELIDADPIVPGQTDGWLDLHEARRASLEASLTSANLGSPSAPIVTVVYRPSTPAIDLLAAAPYFVKLPIEITRFNGRRT